MFYKVIRYSDVAGPKSLPFNTKPYKICYIRIFYKVMRLHERQLKTVIVTQHIKTVLRCQRYFVLNKLWHETQ